MTLAQWSAVDSFVAGHLLGVDSVLDAALAANAAAGLPAIDVSPVQGKLLHLLARAMGATRILEIGTLGGYSTIWLARALADGGKLVTLELDPHHADVARANIERAALSDKVEVKVGPASATLDRMIEAGDNPFDFIFVDADKEGYPGYLSAALRLSRPGTMLVFDNVVREGGVLDPSSDDPRIIGTRALFDAIAAEPRLSATAIQTVGAKKWDGFALAVVGG